MNIILTIARNVMLEIFRKKDFYVLVSLLLLLMFYLVNITFFGMGNIHRYLIEIGLALVFLFSIIITIPFTAKLMIEEIRTKTIYPLLAKPISRMHVILGKFLGGLYASLGCFAIFFIIFSIFSLSKQGLPAIWMHIQVFASGTLMLILLNALVIYFSTFFTFSTSTTLGFMIFFLMTWFGNTLREPLDQLPFIGIFIYYLLPHFEFFDFRHRLIHNWELVPFNIMCMLMLYCLIYTGVLLLLSYDTFKKRWL